MKRNFSMVKINRDNLRSEIEKTGLRMYQISDGIGKSGGYISKCIEKGTMPKTCVNLLCFKYSMDHAFITAPEPEIAEESESDVPVIPDEGWSVNMLCFPRSVELTVYKDGSAKYKGRGKVFQNDPEGLEMARAIYYAAKFIRDEAEQEFLELDEEGIC